MITVRVLFFSLLRDLTGCAETDCSISDGSTMQQLLDQLLARWPGLAAWDRSLLLAMDQTYVARDTVLIANAEIAIMPPVQGG
jgi:molybdopterin synthase sulfur carrier subunit